MDQAQKGSEALAAGKFQEAIDNYTKAIQSNPNAVIYYIQRSIAYLRTAPPNNTAALEDAEKAVVLAYKRANLELIVKAQLRRAIALYNLERYRDSAFIFDFIKRKDPKEKSLQIWEIKLKKKIDELAEDDERSVLTVKEVPEEKTTTAKEVAEEKTTIEAKKDTAAPQSAQQPPQKEIVQTPIDKIKHEWYQNNEFVYFTLLAKGVPKDKAIIDIQAQSLSISFPTQSGSTFDFSLDPLFAAINAEESTSNIMSTKIELKLKKATKGIKWKDLEAEAGTTDSTNAPAQKVSQPTPSTAPSYPTSSKSGPKDWDKLAEDLTAKKSDEKGQTAEDEDIEGDPVNHFFQKLYQGADPDARRAMVKSFTESNGTSLSTDWSSISKEKTATVPPDNMVAKKWGE